MTKIKERKLDDGDAPFQLFRLEFKVMVFHHHRWLRQPQSVNFSIRNVFSQFSNFHRRGIPFDFGKHHCRIDGCAGDEYNEAKRHQALIAYDVFK